nr:MAG TPA: hypothetical protein [Caudoviricetes sp.]
MLLKINFKTFYFNRHINYSLIYKNISLPILVCPSTIYKK